MKTKVRVPGTSFFAQAWRTPWAKWSLIAGGGLIAIAFGVTLFYYLKYARLIEEKLTAGPFAKTSKLYAAPKTVRVGDNVTNEDIAAELRRAGYRETEGGLIGWYRLRPDGIEVFPGPDSYFRQDPFLIKTAESKVSQIVSLRDGGRRTLYQLEPELVTNLFDRNRQKRRIVRYEDIPAALRDAVVSVEDKRFFKHAGFDPLRIMKAAYVDVKLGYHAEGASTLTMQLARGIWLTPEKSWKRKAAETLITLHLERTLTKEQIFEYYANNVDMGRRGSFQILGFGEAAQAYFGKEMKNLTLAEAATLAGLIQRPSFTNPVRWPDRARSRRNIVLSLMRDNGYIDDREYAVAAASPMSVASGAVDSNDAPYFVDLVNDWLQDNLAEHDFQNRAYRVYTTLDPRLQRDATEAVRAGIKEVDDLLEKRRKRTKEPVREAQVALVALDAETGEVKALIGGRSYGVSQLNRSMAKRQPGSIFKPFVYAAAFATALDGNAKTVITPAQTLIDEPKVFYYDDKEYEPNNFGSKFYGPVTIRQALAKSLNIPTVEVAEMVGYGQVAGLARKAGLMAQVGTPSVALGSYDATPIDMAAAYTVFANQGTYVKPALIKAIYSQDGAPVYEAKPEKRKVLDPRVAYMMVNLMEEVLRSGTGAGVRSRGVSVPAAGKTGTSRDAWFAGFTSRLITVVWVGFDDNTDLKLEGAKAALPVWAEFMKRAHQHREYRNPAPFAAPEGVTIAQCGEKSEVFIAGTQPADGCGSPVGIGSQVASWDEDDPASRPVERTVGDTRSRETRVARNDPDGVPVRRAGPERPADAKEKKGLWDKIRGIFK
ncbi:MAG: PBP1A family penicillin-binding protein [Bryobacteraceae bacterium]|nr:PBP1A family penicillin-binding protein [Bryobacteraceae bacterium]